MKKGMKFTLSILAISIGLILLRWGLVSILKYFGLMFRGWVETSFVVVIVLLGLALSGGIIYTLAKVSSSAPEHMWKKVLSGVGIGAVLIGAVVSGIVLLFGWSFSSMPEHVTEKHGQKMVAYVNSFLEVYVEYHEYRNAFVCGYNVIGEEHYGSGGYDPFERDPMPEPKTYWFYDTEGNLIAQSEETPVDAGNIESSGSEQANISETETTSINTLNIDVVENLENELVFTISAEDFVSNYNSLYMKDNNVAYFPSLSKWKKYHDSSPYFIYDSYHYFFTADEEIWSMPTVSIYTPISEPNIYEIKLVFDDYGYQQRLYEIFEEMCSYSLKVLLPDFTDIMVLVQQTSALSLSTKAFWKLFHRKV